MQSGAGPRMSLRGLFRSFRGAAKAQDRPAATHIAWVIVGLGNPDERYRRSRHNLGFMALERLAQRHSAALNERRFKAHLGRCVIAGHDVLLGEPQTYMNLSGEAVAPILGYYKVEPAGNNGIRSIIDALGHGDFVRVRIGIGRPPQGRDAVGYVLQPLSRDELQAFDPVIERAADAAQEIVESGVERAMSKFNQRA